MTDSIRAAFRRQAELCEAVGSPLTGRVIATLAETLDATTRTGARILDWPTDPLIDALPLRICGGLNALVRGGHDAELAQLYATRAGDFAGVLTRGVREWDDRLYPWLDSAPQTNEVARSGVLWPGMMEVARRFGPRIELLELGASGGLNLNMDRFGYDLAGVKSGDPASGVQLAPAWDGPPSPFAPVEVVARKGVDLNPLDVTDPAVSERMLAYIWPDQSERVARAEAAMVIARAHPPLIEAGDGATWIEAQLPRPQAEGVTRIVYHSIALQYFPPPDRARVIAALRVAGASATAARPLAWLFMEFRDTVSTAPDLCLQCWPGSGEIETLAHVHPHGARIEWVVDTNPRF